MKVLVCGGRDFSDTEFLFWFLDEVHFRRPITLVIHGGARGADGLAGHWARAREVPCDVYPANWNKYRNAAGPIRNQQMLDEGTPDLVIAFPGGAGTADMVSRSRKEGVKVHCVNYRSDYK